MSMTGNWNGDEFYGTEPLFDESNNVVGSITTSSSKPEQPKPQRPHPTISVVRAEQSQLSFIKGLIMVESGAGKSYIVATAPKPLVLLTEPNGAMSIQASNPDALIIHIKDLQHMKEVLRAIRDNEIKADFSTIVIDSITELQRMIITDIIKT